MDNFEINDLDFTTLEDELYMLHYLQYTNSRNPEFLRQLKEKITKVKKEIIKQKLEERKIENDQHKRK